MTHGILTRIPVVAGIAYHERVATLPAAFTATLSVEPDNRYFMHAIAVLANGEKVGYVAPEIAASWFEAVKASPTPLTCQGRHASASDRETSGVELLLDFTSLPAPPAA
jgi:hypothetical protein